MSTVRSSRGALITFEGGDWSGKTTQARRLVTRLEESRIPCVFTREPGGTEIGEEIRAILLNPKHAPMSPATELFLYMANRAQHTHQVIIPALAEGAIVVCERFSDATFAYQGAGRGIDRKLIAPINAVASGGLVPDLTIIIDLPPDESARRAAHAERGEDRIEQEAQAFHEKVREEYLRIAEEEPTRVKVVDGRKDVEELAEEIGAVVERFLRPRGLLPDST
jgi:dTMP kinase